ncbi:MAG: 16S rRNA (adenine(1518)-N(6)/adenine(1519)-N(6))-dimethyltransferase RsmA [Bacteroidota bacterium]|nr:16S rRNA (adenine(1518)-N(6)/adenine(1519)-N(6))-dimethyltransferase RsmA [Bacteroidota bacterium]
MDSVRPKKHLGQHFLKDENIARKIVDSLGPDVQNVLEVGPGMGVLTKNLILRAFRDFRVAEIDKESVAYLTVHFPELPIISGDFLKLDLNVLFPGKIAIIGNFPYNISSQIFFKVLENRDKVDEVVGMVQKEVAERIAASPGSKTYGILSVLLQAWYHIDYLFTVNEQVFLPPPKVKSAVIRLTRNTTDHLECDERFFFNLVKTAFNQRRKTLRNAIRSLCPESFSHPFLDKRAEQLSVSDFVELAQSIKR